MTNFVASTTSFHEAAGFGLRQALPLWDSRPRRPHPEKAAMLGAVQGLRLYVRARSTAGCGDSLQIAATYFSNACNSAHDENACFGLSPHAGVPITRTATAFTGSGKSNEITWPVLIFLLLVAVVAG